MDVSHDPRAQKFSIALDGESEAILAYTEVNQTWEVHTVIVPEEFRGQGLAEQLALAAFAKARELGVKIMPACSYVAERFLPKHPELASLVTHEYV